MNSHTSTSSAHRFRYVLRYITWVWSSAEMVNTPVEREWSVPFLWLAVLVMWWRREAWFKGGRVVDALTGRTLFHIYLAGNIRDDGRAHLVRGRSQELRT